MFFLKIRCRKSFTLVELLVVIGILAIITAFGAVNLISFKMKKNFDLDVEKITQAIKSAQEKAIAQENSQGWSIRFTNSASSDDYFEIFPGTTYSSSTVVLRNSLSSSSELTNPAAGSSKTISFSAISGKPLTAQVVSLKQKSGGKNAASIFVSNSGQIRSFFEDGLVGYWPIDENSGTTTYDASSNSNNGTLINTPTWQSGSSCKAGSCLSFNGTNQYVSIYSSTNPTNYVSVSAWFKRQGAPTGGYHIIFMQGTQIEISVPDSSGQIRTGVTTVTLGRQVFNSGSGVTDGKWHFLSLTYDGSYLRAYIDGVKTLEQAVTGALQTGAATNIGYYPGYYANGFIDDVRIYNRALSADEIKRLYESY